MIIALLALVVLWCGWQSKFSSQPPQTPEHKEGAAQTAKESSNNDPFELFWNWTTKDSVSFYTFILAIFTGILGATAIVQIRYLRLSNETASTAAEAAKLSADAANRQVRIAESALLAVEIPYLFVVIKNHRIVVEHCVISKVGTMNADGIGLDEMDYSDVITFCFENAGRTPATIIEFSSTVGFEDWPPAPVIPSAKPSIWATEIVVARGQSKERGCQFGMDKLLFGGGFDREREGLCFKGYVRYADVFENEYIYGFCFAFNSIVGPDGNTGDFYTNGGDGYNYRKKSKSGPQFAEPPSHS